MLEIQNDLCCVISLTCTVFCLRKMFQLFHGCSWRWFAAATEVIYAGLSSLSLFTPCKESDEF